MRCRICDNADGNRSHCVREMMFGLHDVFTYVECGRCGCLQLEAPPADLARYYPDGYYTFATREGSRLQESIHRLRDSYALSGRGLIGRFLAAQCPGAVNILQALQSLSRLNLSKHSEILDVGCGSGRLLCSLWNLGFERLQGVDPFIEGDVSCRPGVRILERSIRELEGQRDLIMSHHSFEHVADPLETLTAAAGLLREGGTCLIRIPTASSYAWKHYGSDWAQVDAPRHAFLHSVESIRLLAAAAGCEVVETVYDSTDFQFWASEQYRRDIPLLSESSYLLNPSRAPFTRAEIKAFQARARDLNAHGLGDSAAFYLRRVGN